MKRITIVIVALIMIGCESKNNIKTITSEEVTVEQFSPPFLHESWINKTYLDKLKETKSTQIAQEYSNMCCFYIDFKKNPINCGAIWNFHEGGGDWTLSQTDEKNGVLVPGDSYMDTMKIIFNPDTTIRIISSEFNNIYVRYGEGTNYPDYSHLINEAIISGKYLTPDSQIVEFLKNGSIYGIDSLNSYELTIDYIIYLKTFDQISFKLNNGKEVTYGYIINNKTLEIFTLGCKEPNGDNHFCEEHIRDSTVMVLTKQ